MVLKTIYITRHGSRANWSSATPVPHSSGRLPPDTPLSAYGQQQASELASHLISLSPSLSAIYSSPFYRCIQTVEPVASSLSRSRDRSVPIHGEPGLGEWYGQHRAADPPPAPADLLQSFFPDYRQDEPPIWTPEPTGESIAELHDRAAYVLTGIIRRLDADPGKPASVLLCTHAATFMALARALTGRVPEDVTEADFEPWTASLSVFERRAGGEGGSVEGEGETKWAVAGERLPDLGWRGGKGVGGGWDCVVNGDCSFLSGGPEKGWRFSGKESFSHTLTTHGVDAGTGLGIISVGGKKE